ncbi:hypothetical protein CY34DRAFT_814212 [Suillus luteus UH-Slu-Lm8-n1]|uniref:Uncharacterized protein n=1 Tax=Suillus luteus UH-Slu-Lm8-n1 TaxID=930992 RepID=A0A0C9ZTE2_9AGAM|nr:hypothetical protein CY34DRAFT_814212 [Suillus luteus UH-Slu-Lm8-n1]
MFHSRQSLRSMMFGDSKELILVGLPDYFPSYRGAVLKTIPLAISQSQELPVKHKLQRLKQSARIQTFVMETKPSRNRCQ